MKRIVIALISFVFFGLSAMSQSIFIPSDWISMDEEVNISSQGEVVTIPFGYYTGGILPEILIESIEESISGASLEGVITNVSVEFTIPRLEGEIYLTFSRNTTEETREVSISASTGGGTVIQPVAQPTVFTLSGGTSPIWHGQQFEMRLSGSEDYVFYKIKRTKGGTSSYSDVTQGTGGVLRFYDSRDGVYTAETDSPVQAAMSGRVSVSYLSFYSLQHAFTSASNTISASGGKYSVAFTPSSSADMTQLATILSAYNSGNSREWDKGMQISYSDGILTISAAPNFSSKTIVNNTWFKNSSGEELVFTQPGGGTLLEQELAFGENNDIISLKGSQPGVLYSLVDTSGSAVSSVTGTGESVTFPLQSAISQGVYFILARFSGQSLTMNEAVTVSPSGAFLLRDNYILKETALTSSGDEVIRDITYYDGLGYPEQIISVTASPSGKNLVTPIWYDAVRRDDARKYLPYVSTASSLQKECSALTSQQTWYASRFGADDGAQAFSLKTYEQSPLNRPLAERKCGSAYSGSSPEGVKETTISYETNVIGEVLLISADRSAGDSVIFSQGFYPAGRLHKTLTTDEDGRSVSTFKDNLGRMILSRTHLGANDFADTYYVYDSRDKISWVITPEGSALLKAVVDTSGSVSWNASCANARKYAYRYSHDGLGRMTEKSTPGADVIYYIYDNADRVVASQDGCQRAGGNRWLLIRYNPFGEEARRYLSAPFTREALTSAFSSEACPESVYSNVGNRLLLERQTGGIRPQGAPAFTSVSGVVTADSLSTSDASRVVWERVYESDLTQDCGVERSFFYDRRGRLRQTVERDAFGGLLTTSMLPDYQGNIKRTVTTYTLGVSVFNVDSSNEYDRRGRLLSSVTSSQGTGVKTDYSYDDLGRLNGATFASLDGQDVLCTRDSVNIQGFVTESSAALAGGTNVYSQQLRYFSPERGTLPLYSGSISEWQQTQGAESDTYGFSYDNAGRLLSGTRYHGQSTAAQTSFTERGLSYDRAGGILSLQRFGSSDSAPDDNLTMTYDGMRLASVSGTVEGQSIDAAMTYDPCGRTTHDGIRGLDYGYDRLGFLTSISGLSSNTPDTLMLYKYLSDGTRMLMTGSGGGSLLYRGPFTLRLTGIGSGSPSVSFLRAETSDNHAAIIADGTQSTGKAYLYVTDHLSSVRAIVDIDGNVMERNDYYTFGKRHTSGRSYSSLASSPFLFSGKEDQSLAKRIADQDATASADLNFLNFGARHYDPVVPRWLTVDPLSEKYYNLNPYSYCAADPVTLVDPDGRHPLVGAIVGAGLDVAIQIGTNLATGEKWDKIDVNSVIISAAAGATGAGLLTKVKQLGNVAKLSKAAIGSAEIITDAAVSGGESAAKQYVATGEVSVKETALDATIGFAASSFGQLGKRAKEINGADELKTLNRQLNRAERVARGSAVRPPRVEKVVKAKNDVEHFGDAEKKAAKTFTSFSLQVINNTYKKIHDDTSK